MTARRVLLSAQAAGRLAEALVSLRSRGLPAFETVVLEDADAGTTVDAAFVSRDITGTGTKNEPSAASLAAYAVLRRSAALQWVHAHSTGADRPIYPELRGRGVCVTTSAGANAAGVAQTALGAVLALARGFPQLMQAQHERRWAPLIGGTLPPDLAGQTVVLVGWGTIARLLQPWLAMLGLRVVVVRRSHQAAGSGIETVRFDALADVLPRADWLVLACSLNEQTRRLVDAGAFARLKPGAMLVNVARGEVVDEAALTQALVSGRLAGAFLDVFEREPLAPESPLWRLPQVIVTPHSAGQAAGNAARVEAIFVANLERWLAGQPLANAID